MPWNPLRLATGAATPIVGDSSRSSSDLQRPASIADQERDIADVAARQGRQAGPNFSDAAQTGSAAHRPGYQMLLEGVARRAFDIIVAESIDRLSRDQEDPTALHKRCQFAGIGIFTEAEGRINELHVGLKGTMSALFLKDLADKMRSGLRGRVDCGSGWYHGEAIRAARASPAEPR